MIASAALTLLFLTLQGHATPVPDVTILGGVSFGVLDGFQSIKALGAAGDTTTYALFKTFSDGEIFTATMVESPEGYNGHWNDSGSKFTSGGIQVFENCEFRDSSVAACTERFGNPGSPPAKTANVAIEAIFTITTSEVPTSTTPPSGPGASAPPSPTTTDGPAQTSQNSADKSYSARFGTGLIAIVGSLWVVL
ncbi:hypothetical protein C8J57DRAFT_232424 [Mycena rebaudengoi]|nr:hypothetical protein C8J57DRAFT_232424 [Mycena rebaudengoi]